jgi:hypothetical protein
MTRRDFLGFFVFAGFVSLLRRKLKGPGESREAMFWKKVDL